MSHLSDKIRGSFSRIFDHAEPANVDEHRRSCLSATQRENIEAILADMRRLNKARDDYRFPSKRVSVLTWLYRGEGATLDDLDDQTRLAVERAGLEGDHQEILRQDGALNEAANPIAARAKLAIQDAHKTLLPHLHAELKRVKSVLDPLFARYGCGHEVDDSGPCRTLTRSIMDSEQCARGEFGFDAGHIENELPLWL